MAVLSLRMVSLYSLLSLNKLLQQLFHRRCPPNCIPMSKLVFTFTMKQPQLLFLLLTSNPLKVGLIVQFTCSLRLLILSYSFNAWTGNVCFEHSSFHSHPIIYFIFQLAALWKFGIKTVRHSFPIWSFPMTSPFWVFQAHPLLLCHHPSPLVKIVICSSGIRYGIRLRIPSRRRRMSADLLLCLRLLPDVRIWLIVSLLSH